MEFSKEQLEIIEAPIDEKTIVMAAAASGKTRVLIERLKYVIDHGVDPSRIVVLTFTNNAAAEMRDRPESPLSDRAIVRTTEILQKYFRSVDRICRWKDDEFVIIMSRINSSMKNRLLSKLARMNEESEADGLILTGGAAFSDPDDTGKDILSAAQEALEESLSENKGGCIFR